MLLHFGIIKNINFYGGLNMKKFYVIFKGGKQQFVSAENQKEAVEKVRELLSKYEIVGVYEVQ